MQSKKQKLNAIVKKLKNKKTYLEDNKLNKDEDNCKQKYLPDGIKSSASKLKCKKSFLSGSEDDREEDNDSANDSLKPIVAPENSLCGSYINDGDWMIINQPHTTTMNPLIETPFYSVAGDSNANSNLGFVSVQEAESFEIENF